MQLEAVEPAPTAFSTLGELGKDLVARDTAVVADRQWQAVNKGQAGGLAQTRFEVGRQRNQHGWKRLNQTWIADQIGKLGPPMTAHLFAVEVFEGAVI